MKVVISSSYQTVAMPWPTRHVTQLVMDIPEHRTFGEICKDVRKATTEDIAQSIGVRLYQVKLVELEIAFVVMECHTLTPP